MAAERTVMSVKRVGYFGEFGYLNSSSIRKGIILMFLSSSRDKLTLLIQNSKADVSIYIRSPCRCASGICMASPYKS